MSHGSNNNNPGAGEDQSRLLSSFSTEPDTDSPEIVSPASTFVGSHTRNSSRQPRHRPGYARLTSLSPESAPRAHFESFDDDGDITTRPRGDSQGLGIMSGHSRHEPNDSDLEGQVKSGASVRSLPYSFSSTAPLNESGRSAHKFKTSEYGAHPLGSIRSRKSYADFSPHVACASREHIWKGAAHHVYITLLVLSVFSTIFSGIYLGIAVARPRYGKFISDQGNLTYSNATLLFALFAKLTELSFITCFIAFVGQVVSRRAFNRSKGYGVSLAEISMRSWIMQPGQMLVHPHAVKYAAVSLMGLLAILAALTAMLYTTAASALVSPQLLFSDFRDQNLQNTATRGFGDMQSIEWACASPVQNDVNGTLTKYQTCVIPEFGASSLNDWSTWLKQWTNFANTTEGSVDPHVRPQGYSLVGETTTVKAAWIENRNMTSDSEMFDRIVNNVTMAMPHGAVIDAALNPNNSILQPKVNDGFGSYNMHAAVVSPAINVVCAEMSKDEISPLVYEEWPNANRSLDLANWANKYAIDPKYVPSYGENEWLNRTVVDHIFGFGPSFGQRRPPVFSRLPSVYNTILNQTGAYPPLPYRDAVYVLGAAPDSEGNVRTYPLCQMRAVRTSKCSTWYNATSSTSYMSAQCEDDQDPLQFSKHGGDRLPSGNDTTSVYWVDMAGSLVNAISLGTGIADEDAAIARQLMQFFPETRALNPKMPSLAEALAVTAGSTLMLGARNAGMASTTDDGDKTAPVIGNFTTRMQSQQYGSGPVSAYQNLFYIVLFAVFAGNMLVLTWLILNRGLVQDFCDPANLFCLTINSPPSHLFAGSCGCGPHGKQYQDKWYVNVDGDHVFIENDERESELAENRLKAKMTPDVGVAPSPIMQTFSKLSKRKSVL